MKTVGKAKIPILGLGTWHIGGSWEKDDSRDKQSIALIKKAISIGITHIDTSGIYGGGHTEEIVGKAIEIYNRDKLFISTKIKNTLKYNEVIAAAEASLKRMNTEYIDLYIIHSPSTQVPLSETMKAMNFLVSEGFIKNIGVSNFSLPELKEAQKYAEIAANQIEYNLLFRNTGMTKNAESDILPYCKKNNIAIIAHRPLAKGKLANPGCSVLDSISEKYSKTRAQIALNWLTSKGICAIPKTSKIERLKENLESLDFQMEAKDVELLDNFDNLAK